MPLDNVKYRDIAHASIMARDKHNGMAAYTYGTSFSNKPLISFEQTKPDTVNIIAIGVWPICRKNTLIFTSCAFGTTLLIIMLPIT